MILLGVTNNRMKQSDVLKKKLTCQRKDSDKCHVRCVAFKDGKRNPELKDDGRCEDDRYTFQKHAERSCLKQPPTRRIKYNLLLSTG